MKNKEVKPKKPVKPVVCWNCHSTDLSKKVDKVNPHMVYWICNKCGATVSPERKK